MDTKLTLKLDKDVIEKAKEYAAKQKISVSFIVENYLKAITSMKKVEAENEIKVSELAKKMSIDGIVLPDDFDYKKELQDALCEKYGL